MTASQSRYRGGGCNGYSARPQTERNRSYDQRASSARSRTASQAPEAPPVLYVYDRICRKESKQRQLYRAYGVAAGAPQRQSASRRSGAPPLKKPRYKIMLESIINLFDSIDERRKRDVEAAKRSAVMRKKFLEYKRGFFLALFIIAVLTGFALLTYRLFFGIQTIDTEGTAQYSAQEVAQASGIEIGDGLYSFRADEAEARITFVCPYIRSVEISRGVPNRVSLSLESDEAVYYADVYGEKLLLSAGLRVLGEYDDSYEGELIELYLPELQYSVRGRVVSFVDEKQERFVRSVLSTLQESGLFERICMADLRNVYDITMYCDSMYRLNFGGEKELAYKLKMAERTLSNADFNQGTPAEIDLNIVGEATVRYDHNLKYVPGEKE